MITVKLNFKTCLESSFDFAILYAGFISIKVRYNFKINPQKIDQKCYQDCCEVALTSRRTLIMSKMATTQYLMQGTLCSVTAQLTGFYCLKPCSYQKQSAEESRDPPVATREALWLLRSFSLFCEDLHAHHAHLVPFLLQQTHRHYS